MALARLGEADVMRTIVCELQTGEAKDRFNAVYKLRYAGGGTAVSALIAALGHSENNLTLQEGNVMIGNIRQAIVEALNTLARRDQLIPSSLLIPRDRAEWEKWEVGNRERLMQLLPVPKADQPQCEVRY